MLVVDDFIASGITLYMADIDAPLRSTDSWSTTEVRSVTHNHVWTIPDFSQCDCKYLETSTRVRDLSSTANTAAAPGLPSADDEPPTILFRIRLHPRGNKESSEGFTFFQCFSNRKTNQLKVEYKFKIFNSRGEEIATTVYTGTLQLSTYFEYIRRDLLIGHLLPQDELQLNLELIVTFYNTTETSQAQKGLLK